MPAEKKLRFVYSEIPLPGAMSLPGAVVRQKSRGFLNGVLATFVPGYLAIKPGGEWGQIFG